MGFMAMKLDMSKAYDRVERRYLGKIMEKLGFCDKWVSLVFECITTVSYSILVNGEPKEILCLHTFFCYAQKVWIGCYNKQPQMTLYGDFLYVKGDQKSHTYFL